MPAPNIALVSGIRAASRQLVRELGFLNKTVAGTGFSASAVHALIEIGATQGINSRQLSDVLHLEKSTVSRLVKSLEERGSIRETASDTDARAKNLSLTDRGRATLGRINDFAESQVCEALERLDSVAQQRVLRGLQDYSDALGNSAPASRPARHRGEVTIQTGYVSGIIGAVVGLMAPRIDQQYHFGAAFEARIAADLAEFSSRLDASPNQIWRAEVTGQIVGSVSIDGQDLGSGLAHLRWFVVDPVFSGKGIGQALLAETLAFCDRQGFRETHLWTLKGLDAARSLYERHGFDLAEEYQGDQWGGNVTELKFVRSLPEARPNNA